MNQSGSQAWRHLFAEAYLCATVNQRKTYQIFEDILWRTYDTPAAWYERGVIDHCIPGSSQGYLIWIKDPDYIPWMYDAVARGRWHYRGKRGFLEVTFMPGLCGIHVVTEYGDDKTEYIFGVKGVIDNQLLYRMRADNPFCRQILYPETDRDRLITDIVGMVSATRKI